MADNTLLNQLAQSKIGQLLGLGDALGTPVPWTPPDGFGGKSGGAGASWGYDPPGSNAANSKVPAKTVAPANPGPVWHAPTPSGSIPTIGSDPLTSLIPTVPAPPLPTLNVVNNIDDAGMVGTLPIRGEKRIIPASINVAAVQATFEAGAAASGTNLGQTITNDDFYVTGAKAALTDFIKVVVPHRGLVAATGQFAPNQDAVFHFLINPRTIAVSKQTVDTQAFTRGGWQFGVWGEDISQIRISGVTAGSYFAMGLTDEYQYYAKSYRNLLQLQQVFENNGYWFEGEEYNEGPMAADYLRRRIRMHQDLKLWVGNFIWSGMFESMNITQNADNPFQLEFELTFIAWKERYRDSSGYWDGIHNEVQRGHSYDAVAAVTGKTANSVTVAQTTAVSTDSRLAALANSVGSNPNANSPAVIASSAEDQLFTVDPQAWTNYGPTENLLLSPVNLSFWNK